MLKFIKNLFLTRISDKKKNIIMNLIELLDSCEIPRNVQNQLLTKVLKQKDDELEDLIYEFSNLNIAKKQLVKTKNELNDFCLKKSKEIDKKIVEEVHRIRKDVEMELKNFGQ